MPEKTIPAMRAPAPARDNPLTRSVAGMVGMAFLAVMLVACVGTLPWTLAKVVEQGMPPESASPRYDVQIRTARHLPPFWAPGRPESGEDTPALRSQATARELALRRIAHERGVSLEQLDLEKVEPSPAALASSTPQFWLGTDLLGRSVLIRCLTGGGISLCIGIAAAGMSVLLGTLYGAISGYIGGRTDAVLMRIVDVLYGLPYILLVVLLAVAMDATVERWQVSRAAEVREQRAAWIESQLLSTPEGERAGARETLETAALVQFGSGEVEAWAKQAIGIVTLLVAIGGVSWLTMARVVRGQVLSLKAQPFMEAARAMGVGVRGQFIRHLLPNLVGPITVYATLTVPQAILQESFLSFLGIGVRPPLPSWGNLAADALPEVNPFRSHWWLLASPCILLGLTLLALNFVGEGLREALDPKRSRR